MKKDINIITLDISLKGGIERVISLLANEFHQNGHRVKVYSLFNEHKNPSYFFEDGVEVIYLNPCKSGADSFIGKIKYYILMLASIRKIRSEAEGVLLSTLMNISCFLGFLNFFSFRQIQFIAAEHSQYHAHSSFIQSVRKVCYKNAKYIVTLTESDRKVFNKLFDKSKVKAIPNPTSFSCLGSSASIKHKRLITIGRLVEVKDYSRLLKDLATFFSTHPEWVLDIYGEGELRMELMELCYSLSIDKNVNFKGFVDDVEGELQYGSLYLCSSKTEAFPMAFLEAFSVGLPIISYDCPVGPREIITDGDNGILLKERESKTAFSSAIEELLSHGYKYEKMTQSAFENAKIYNINATYRAWIRLFSNMN